MKSKYSRDELKRSVRSNIEKIEKSKKERSTILAQTAYLGTIGLLFILPVIIGAYLGVWLDGKLKGFSFSWTVSFIILGVFIGAMNVYLFVKDRL